MKQTLLLLLEVYWVGNLMEVFLKQNAVGNTVPKIETWLCGLSAVLGIFRFKNSTT